MRYLFACEFGTREWRTHESQQTSWDNVRYELEVTHHLHGRRWSRVCLFAMHVDDWVACKRKFTAEKSLRGVTVIRSTSKIILFRRPYPVTFTRNGAYVPPVFRITSQPNLSEDEMIATLCTATTLRGPGEIRHPADYNYVGMCPVPDVTYVCHGCQKIGHHFRWDCPLNEAASTTVRPLDHVPRPHGIPKTFLRKVGDGERGRGAMRDEFGTFYVWKTPSPRHTPAVVPEPGRHMEAPVVPSLPEEQHPEECENWHMDMVSVQYNDDGEVLEPTLQVGPPPDESGADTTLLIEQVMTRRDELEAVRVREFYANNPDLRVKKQSTCIHWLHGLCVKGALQCEFLHSALSTHMPICKFFAKGECSNSECKFRHVKPAKSPCASFTEGFCPWGPRCPNDHVRRHVPVKADWVGRDAKQFNKLYSFLQHNS